MVLTSIYKLSLFQSEAKAAGVTWSSDKKYYSITVPLVGILSGIHILKYQNLKPAEAHE